MNNTSLENTSIHLVGCGRMGSALLKGWLGNGLDPSKTSVSDPHPGSWLTEWIDQGLVLTEMPETPPEVVVFATKPQVVDQAIKVLSAYGNGDTLFISIAAGKRISSFEAGLGDKTPLVRAMPNLPVEVGFGVTGLVSSKHVNKTQKKLADNLFRSVGTIVTLEDENHLHTVTGLSGSGPAYVFSLVEALEASGCAAGLSLATARQLAIGTVLGSAQMMVSSDLDPQQLRQSVCSPAGTTEAALKKLLKPRDGLDALISETVEAAISRSEELSG